MFNDTSYEIAFDICVDSMVRMIEKYEGKGAKNEKKKIKCEDKGRYPADNTESSAVVCNREDISVREKE